MSNDDLTMTGDQQRVLQMAIDFYIRLGLGQFTEIATRFDLLYGKRLNQDQLDRLRQLCEEMEQVACDNKPWSIQKDASTYTLNALLLEAQVTNDTETRDWCLKRIEELKAENH